MAKRKTTKRVPRQTDVNRAANRLHKALTKQTKSVLLDLIVDVASKDRTIMRKLEEQFDIEAPTGELVAATRQAISDATDFDDREVNYNFDYDYQAYETVGRNLKRLVDLRCFTEAMELSVELMGQASYQVESSDEGLMTADIEECLQIVIKAITKSDLPAADVTAWCVEMTKRDRVGFICDGDLAVLAKKVKR